MPDIAVAGVFEQQGVRSGDRRVLVDSHQTAGPEGRVLPRHDATRESARPPVLVVEPRVAANLLRSLHGGGYAFEPGIAQIGGQQAAAGVQEDTAETALLESAELPVELGRI